MVLCAISSRFTSATAAMMVKLNLPAGVLVSMPSCREMKSMSLARK
ncbi:hypothetical protein WMF19_43160 [Sorangium sp. So ce124]